MTRLTGIVASTGIEANRMLYCANRLAPVALDMPDTCEAIRDDLDRLISAFLELEDAAAAGLRRNRPLD